MKRKMKKLSKRQVIKISKRHDEFQILLQDIRSQKNPNQKQIDRLIDLMKAKVKKEPSVIAKFKEYSIPIDAIEDISISFVPLDVSAKTKNKKIYLNNSMLKNDSEVLDPTSYAVHECIHFAQQLTGNTKGHEKSDYLSKDTEQEAFKAQIDYKKRNEGNQEAKEYLDDLLDYHDKDGKERTKLKSKLSK